jgi:hypothetical protein
MENMFNSLGIDNLIVEKRLTQSEIAYLVNTYPQTVENVYALIWHKAFFSPVDYGIVANINIPKIVFGNNVRLALPEHIAQALVVLERATNIDIRDAKVIGAHSTFIQEIGYSFVAARNFFQLPRRGYKTKLMGDNVYYNEKSGRKVLSIYDKSKLLKYIFPKNIEFEGDLPELFRLELKVEKALLRQLKERGLWTFNGIFVSDLIERHGFHALMQLFESVVGQFIKGDSKLTLSLNGKKEAVQRKYFYDALSDSEAWLSFQKENCQIDPSVIFEIEAERNLYLAESRKDQLIQNMNSSFNSLFNKYSIIPDKTKRHVL